MVAWGLAQSVKGAKLVTVSFFVADREVTANVRSECDRDVRVFFNPKPDLGYAEVCVRIALEDGESTAGKVTTYRPD